MDPQIDWSRSQDLRIDQGVRIQLLVVIFYPQQHEYHCGICHSDVTSLWLVSRDPYAYGVT